MKIKEITKYGILTNNIYMTVKNDIILTISYMNFETNDNIYVRLDEVRSINAINGFDIRKDKRYIVASPENIKNVANSLNLLDWQLNNINLMISQNYKHNILLDIALQAFQYKEENLQKEAMLKELKEEIKQELLAEILKERLNKKDEVTKKVKI